MMTDPDIVKAAECCLTGRCKQCPRMKIWLQNAWDCRYELMKETFSLVVRQQRELEQVKQNERRWNSIIREDDGDE